MKRRKKRFITISVSIFTAAALAVGVYLLFFAPRGAVYSDRENRMLAERPTLTLSSFLDDSYADSLESYLLDHFPMRDLCIDAGTAIKQAGSFASWDDLAMVMEANVTTQEIENAQIAADDVPLVTPRPTKTPAPATPTPNPTDSPAPTATLQSGEPTAVPSATPAPTETPAPTPTARPTKPPADVYDYPLDLCMYIKVDGTQKHVAQYARGEVKRSCSLFDAYASLLPDDGVVVMTYVPDSRRITRMLSFDEPQGMTSEIEPFIHAFTADKVTAISTADILGERAVAGEYVYYRTDRHWTPIGAYTVLKEMLAEAGETLPPFEAFPTETEYPFLGTVYRDSPSRQMKENPDTMTIIKPMYPCRALRYTSRDEYTEIPLLDYNVDENDRYCIYLGGPSGPLKIAERTDIEPESTCLLVCDSFGLETVPMLLSVYDRVIVYDARYYDRSELGSISGWVDRYAASDIFVIINDGHAGGGNFYKLCNEQF